METALASPVLIELVTGALAFAGVYVTHKFARAAQKEESTAERVTKLEQRERLRDDYIHLLRNHIAEEKGPPPPSWPEGLTR